MENTFGCDLWFNPRAWLAEAIATYALVFFGPLSVILSVVVFGDGLTIESILMISLGHGVGYCIDGICIWACIWCSHKSSSYNSYDDYKKN